MDVLSNADEKSASPDKLPALRVCACVRACLWLCRRMGTGGQESFSTAFPLIALSQGLSLRQKFVASARLAGHLALRIYLLNTHGVEGKNLLPLAVL